MGKDRVKARERVKTKFKVKAKGQRATALW
jgi:hypothetical protein